MLIVFLCLSMNFNAKIKARKKEYLIFLDGLVNFIINSLEGNVSFD